MGFLVSIVIVGLFCWNSFSTVPILGYSLTINLPALLIAAAITIICAISYMWVPKKYVSLVSIAIYLLSTAMSAVLIFSTGGLSSPFIILWVFVGIFAAIFKQWGMITVLLLSAVFAVIEYRYGWLTNDKITLISFYSLLPLAASFAIWHDKSSRDEIEGDDRAYKTLANELNEVANKSEVVINAIGDGVIAIDSQGVIQLINPAAQQIIGWGKQDALSLNYKSVLQLINNKNENLEPNNDPIQQVLNNNQQVRTSEFAIMTKNEKKLMISLVVSPVGNIGSGVIAVFHDVTKEKAEEREQAEFISTASHEMRTPVASIEGYLSLALNPQTAQVDARAQDFITKAHASARHLGHLFQDLLDVSKADDGRLSNNPQLINIVPFVHDVVQGLAPKAKAKGLNLIFKPMPEGTTERFIAPAYSVNLDNDHIREIVNNLVENAIKYTPFGEIVVDISGNEDHITISIKDSGIGIPAEDMPHLFQKFYRVDNKDTREIGGTGLGLYLCRRLSEIMGGRIWAESIKGSGSTFYVELPRLSSREAAMLSARQTIENQNTPEQIVVQTPIQQIPTPQPTENPQPPPTFTEPPKPVVTETPNSVPRGQALTPEQIAAYVTKQRALAQKEAALHRTQPATFPDRNNR